MGFDRFSHLRDRHSHVLGQSCTRLVEFHHSASRVTLTVPVMHSKARREHNPIRFLHRLAVQHPQLLSKTVVESVHRPRMASRPKSLCVSPSQSTWHKIDHRGVCDRPLRRRGGLCPPTRRRKLHFSTGQRQFGKNSEGWLLLLSSSTLLTLSRACIFKKFILCMNLAIFSVFVTVNTCWLCNTSGTPQLREGVEALVAPVGCCADYFSTSLLPRCPRASRRQVEGHRRVVLRPPSHTVP